MKKPSNRVKSVLRWRYRGLPSDTLDEAQSADMTPSQPQMNYPQLFSSPMYSPSAAFASNLTPTLHSPTSGLYIDTHTISSSITWSPTPPVQNYTRSGAPSSSHSSSARLRRAELAEQEADLMRQMQKNEK